MKKKTVVISAAFFVVLAVAASIFAVNKYIKYNETSSGKGMIKEITVDGTSYTYSLLTDTLKVSGETVTDPSTFLRNSETEKSDFAFWAENTEKIVFSSGIKDISYDFKDFKNVRKIELSETVESMGSYIFDEKPLLKRITVSSDNPNFYCNKNGDLFRKNDLIRVMGNDGLTEYTVPDYVECIEYNAFSGCENLKKIIIGKNFKIDYGGMFLIIPSLEKIEINKDNPDFCSDSQGAVYNKDMSAVYAVPPGVEEYTLPETVTYNLLPESVSGVKKININENYNFVDSFVNRFCDLEAVVVPKGNRWCSSENGVLFNKEKTELIFYPPMKPDESYSVPSGVTRIYRLGGKKLKSLNISDSVKSIEGFAFMHCESLETVFIGKGLERFEVPGEYNDENENPFAFSDKLKCITVDKHNRNFLNDSFGALYTADMKHLITVPANAGITEYTVPDTVVDLIYGFVNCSGIEVINIGSGVEQINVGVKYGRDLINETRGFKGCLSFREINVSAENKRFESIDGVLYDKEQKQLALYPPAKEGDSFSIPSWVVWVGDFAFDNNKYLKRIFVPAGIKNEPWCFFDYDCRNLLFDVYFEAPEWRWSNPQSGNKYKVYYNCKGLPS